MTRLRCGKVFQRASLLSSFFFLMSVVGMLEGMQIAFFAVAKKTPAERGEGVFARKTCALLYFGEGNNLPGFMIGRQLLVVSCMFFVARVLSVRLDGDEENILVFPTLHKRSLTLASLVH